MTEAQLQEQIAQYLRLQYPNVLFHSDFGSGIKMTKGQAIKQKRQNGGIRGWPDLFVAEPVYEEVEQWKDIENYEGVYKISDHARIKRINGDEEHFIGIQVNKRNGYCYAHLSKNGKVKAFRVHRLVAEHFIANQDNKAQVNHKDGNKENNIYSNLEWVSASENQKHRYRVLKKTNGGRPSKKVRCVETGVEYNTIAEATRKTGFGHIAAVIRGERHSAGGFRWQEL